jgi:hypothetical protein
MPNPGLGLRQKLPALLADSSGLAVVLDTVEPRTHRQTRRPRAYDSGNRKAHTFTSQVGMDGASGHTEHQLGG